MESYIPETNKEINQLVDAFIEAMVNTATISFPKSKSINNSKRVPWWNEEVALAIRDKKRPYNIFKRTRTLDLNTVEPRRGRSLSNQ